MAGFALAVKHSVSFIITNGIGNLISFLGKTSIAAGNAFISYLILSEAKSFQGKIDNIWVPVAIIFALSYIMGAVFMSVYSITSLTLLQCLYADADLQSQKRMSVFKNSNRPKEMTDIVLAISKDS